MLARLATLLLVAPGVGAVRRDAAGSSRDSSLSNVTSPFQCPDACQECCTAHKWDLGVLAWGVSKDKYKCILKSSGTLPDVSCDKPQKRDHAARQAKAKCPFKKGDLGSKPWSQLETTPCSRHNACCCRKSWTEDRCFGMEETAAFVTAPSTHEEAKEGQNETYKRMSQAYGNEGPCVGEEGLKFQRRADEEPSKHGRCCVETRDKYVVKMVNCRTEVRWCEEFDIVLMVPAKKRCDEEVCDEEKVWFKKCTAYEQLYHCSEKGQEHAQTGTLYQRISTAGGLCVGDQSTPEALERVYGPGDYQGVRLSPYQVWNSRTGKDVVVAECPEGFTSGRDCKCNEECGGVLHVLGQVRA